MNSMAQHAVPNGYGQREPFLAQLIREEAVVVKKFSRAVGSAVVVLINPVILTPRKPDPLVHKMRK